LRARQPEKRWPYSNHPAIALHELSRVGAMPETNPKLQARLLTPKEAAGFLSVSTRTLSRIVQQGYLPIIRVGGSNRFTMTDLTDYIARNRMVGHD
jgi:excisionase family DNA binding protein